MADVIPIQQGAGLFKRVRRNTVRRVLDQAKGCEEILVIGLRDEEIWLRGCPNDPGQALWLMEMAKKKLLGL